MPTYNNKDIYLERASGSYAFEEYPLRITPDSVVMIDTTGSIHSVNTSSFINLILSSSIGSASYSTTSSYALNGGSGGSVSSSYANQSSTSSYMRLFNITTNSWYTLQISGSVGQETIQIVPTS
jgi:hypothetical protein